MDSPNKRVLTDEFHQSASNSDQFSRSSSAGTPEDILQSLRSVGARARKSVLEGYRTTPSTFSRAQSTGSIFRSMNDTLNEVYSTTTNPPIIPTDNVSSRKRSHSVTDYDIDDRETIPDDDSSKAAGNQNIANVLENPVFCRPIKALKSRARQPWLETRSLPAGTFSFGTNVQVSGVTSSKTVGGNVKEEEDEEEEDWSQGDLLQNSEQAFEPMSF